MCILQYSKICGSERKGQDRDSQLGGIVPREEEAPALEEVVNSFICLMNLN